MAGVKLFLSCVSDEFGAYRDALRPACTLARSPIRDPLIEGFSHVVTSMTAPIASGWSESPGGTCTHWKAPPCHGVLRRSRPLQIVSFHDCNISDLCIRTPKAVSRLYP